MKRCIIVQGPAYSNSIAQIRECWKEYDVIYSTWEGGEILYTSDEKVIYSKLPPYTGVKNLNYQKISTIAGLKLAKELGYERALKWRSDMWTNNASELLSKFTDGYNTMCWVDSEGGYLTDYWMEDTIDNLLLLWDIEPNGDFPEKVLTDRIKELGWIDRVNLLIEHLNTNLDIFWNTRYGPYWMHVNNEHEIYKNNTTWKKQKS
jgi:predicted Rdx family selenoprotein